MSAVEIFEPSQFWRTFVKKREFPIPINLTRVRLRHGDGTNHYLYIIELGYGKETYFHDSATDYSGTGGRYREEMDEIFKNLSEHFEVQIREMEMDFELYWKLKNIFYRYYKTYFTKELSKDWKMRAT
jgi:hypothetical protein